MYNFLNMDNMAFHFDGEAELIYCDPVYEDPYFKAWIHKYWQHLSKDGVFIIQTDWHTCAEMWVFMKEVIEATFVSHSVWKNEWGNHPSRQPHQCFDDILIFAKGKDYKYYPERVQVPKVTKSKGLNPSGRETKTATAWIDDICLTTVSKERVKKEDGHLIRWQKPVKLFDRIVRPFTDEEDLILDPFAGSASLGVWCIQNFRDYVGIENDLEVWMLADERLRNVSEIVSPIQLPLDL